MVQARIHKGMERSPLTLDLRRREATRNLVRGTSRRLALEPARVRDTVPKSWGTGQRPSENSYLGLRELG